jgi:hypothetical protein
VVISVHQCQRNQPYIIAGVVVTGDKLSPVSLGKKHYMNVNSSPTASEHNMEKLPFSSFFSFIAGFVDTGD